MDQIREWLSDPNHRGSLIIAIAAIAIVVFMRFLKESKKAKYRSHSSGAEASGAVYNAKFQGSAEVISNVLMIVFLVAAVLMIMQLNGLNVSGALAGLGIASTIIGFALQDLLKDMIMGIRILAENLIIPGDGVRIGDITGIVISINLHYTTIERVDNHSLVHICNRDITEVEVLSHLMDIIVPFSYDVSYDTASATVKKICGRIWMLEGIENCYYRGVKEFGESAVLYTLRCFSKVENQPDLKVAINGIICDEYEKRGLQVPYNQLDLHLVSTPWDSEESSETVKTARARVQNHTQGENFPSGQTVKKR